MNILSILRRLANPELPNSLTTVTRKKNFSMFKSFISPLPRPLKILDIGGIDQYWEKMNFTGEDAVYITLLNLSKVREIYPNFKSVAGDARDLRQFKDGEFDIVFSHSVIEHVGGFADQRRMANEIRRVGKRFFLQTPNRYFPMEPHFLFPLFQFLPQWLRVWLVSHFELGWYKRTTDKQEAIEIVNSIRLLRRHELQKLFPGATIYREKFLGLTKSFIVYDGWDLQRT